MKQKEAVYLFNKYADCRGLVKVKDIIDEGFTIEEAEEQGIVIKENVRKYSNRIVSDKSVKVYERKRKR
jgi:hypothetical protein